MNAEYIYNTASDYITLDNRLRTKYSERAKLETNYEKMLQGRLQNGGYDEEGLVLVLKAYEELEKYDNRMEELEEEFDALKDQILEILDITKQRPFTITLGDGEELTPDNSESYTFYLENGEVRYRKN
jgi:hypothetical protein